MTITGPDIVTVSEPLTLCDPESHNIVTDIINDILSNVSTNSNTGDNDEPSDRTECTETTEDAADSFLSQTIDSSSSGVSISESDVSVSGSGVSVLCSEEPSTAQSNDNTQSEVRQVPFLGVSKVSYPRQRWGPGGGGVIKFEKNIKL